MDPITWTGALGPIVNPIMGVAVVIFILGFLANTVLVLAGRQAGEMVINDDHTLSFRRTPVDHALATMRYATLLFILMVLVFIVGGVVMSDPVDQGIIGAMAGRFLPVWVAMIAIFSLSIYFKRNLGLYGKLFDNLVGMIGFGIVLFWILTSVFWPLIITHDSLVQISALRNDPPGSPLPSIEDGQYAYYLLGGDALGRDVFSRMVQGAFEVMKIAPWATVFAFMVGITLGLPAGYFGGRMDSIITFIANLVLSFPVILLFYLLVTPEIVQSGVPVYMSAVLFVFPIIFLTILFNSRYFTQPRLRNFLVGMVIIGGGWLYLSLISEVGDLSPLTILPASLDLFDLDGQILIVFVSVVFVNSPTVFRIVRGLALDIQTRDYVAAAQTRGEGPWYIMLWEILPNARGPLIVDFCLRIGYTTILLGTLGFFGLGLHPESPDWGSTINAGRRLLTVYSHPPLPPALALMSLVLGLNLLADGLREESLKD